MSPLNPPLNKNDFNNICWQDVINGSKRKDCRSYSSSFFNKLKETENPREREVFEILVAVSSPKIKPESTEEFFADIFQNLTDDRLDFLTDIAPEILDPELQARVVDILWVKR
jgi:hypothetical protein